MYDLCFVQHFVVRKRVNTDKSLQAAFLHRYVGHFLLRGYKGKNEYNIIKYIINCICWSQPLSHVHTLQNIIITAEP